MGPNGRRVADPRHVDTAGLAAYLAGQKDLGRTGIPRLLRFSANLPVTGSNKVLKRELQAQRWHTDDPVYRWAGRGEPSYTPMSAADKDGLDAEFSAHGRQRYL